MYSGSSAPTLGAYLVQVLPKVLPKVWRLTLGKKINLVYYIQLFYCWLLRLQFSSQLVL